MRNQLVDFSCGRCSKELLIRRLARSRPCPTRVLSRVMKTPHKNADGDDLWVGIIYIISDKDA